ncbi:MAG TPA: hypothetical protein VGK27_06180 [Candidatus Deferrimicrobiaceae bacterium]
MNLYQYVGNDPVNLIDHYGLAVIQIPNSSPVTPQQRVAAQISVGTIGAGSAVAAAAEIITPYVYAYAPELAVGAKYVYDVVQGLITGPPDPTNNVQVGVNLFGATMDALSDLEDTLIQACKVNRKRKK